MQFPFSSAIFLALAINFVYGKAVPNPQDSGNDGDEFAKFELHDDAYCNNPNPKYLSVKDTDCHVSGTDQIYIKAVNYKADMKDDAGELLFLLFFYVHVDGEYWRGVEGLLESAR